MALCRSCNSESARVITHFEGPDGQPLAEPRDACPQCRPEEFDLLLDPSDRRFWPNWLANPQEYDTLEFEDGERVPVIKDWARGEFEQRVAEGPVAKAEEAEVIERKRAFARERNKTPLTRAYIEARVNGFRAQFELAERMMNAEAAGVVLP